MNRNTRLHVERALARGVLQLPKPLVARLGGGPVRRDGRTLDPQLAAMIRLDQLRGPIDVTQYAPPIARKKLAAGFALLEPDLDQSVTASPLTVAGASGPLEARLYVPSGAATPSPLVVFFHGGGMVIGDLETHDSLCRQVAARAKCRVVAVAYRLSPEHPFPAAPDDATAAFFDLAARAPTLGGDPNRLAVMGDSAGGTLSATVAQRAVRGPSRPALQVLIYPATELTGSMASHNTFAEGFLLTRRMIDWFMDHYFPGSMDRRRPDASPLFCEDVSQVAPALVYTAGFDPLRDEGKAYADKLLAAGVRVRHHEFDSLVHGFAQMSGAVDAANAAVDLIADELAAALKPL